MSDTKKILIIEDNPGDVILMKEYLKLNEEYTFEISTAESATQANAQLKTDDFDVLLMDLGLPESFGAETLEHFENVFKNNCAIIITGNSDTDIGKQALQLGVQDYLNKNDIRHENLNKAINFALERFEINQTLKSKDRAIRKLKKAIDSSRNALATVDTSFRVEYANEIFNLIFNLDTTKQKEHLFDIIPEIKNYQKEILVRDSWLRDLQLTRKETRWYRLEIQKIPGNEGFTINLTDITWKKQSEFIILENEAKLSAIVDSFSDILYITDLNGIVSEIWGQELEELEIISSEYHGKPIEEIFYSKELFTKALIDVKRGTVAEFQITITDKEKIKHYTHKLSPLKTEGKITGILGVARNITDLKNNEKNLIENERNLRIAKEELSTIIKTIPNPMYYKNGDGKYTYVNFAFADFFKKSPQDFIGKSINNLYDDNETDQLIKHFEANEQIFTREKESVSYVSRMKNGKGETREVEIIKRGLLNPDGKITGIIGLFKDITEQVKREKDLIRIKTKMELLANISFDLLKINSTSDLHEYLSYKIEEITEGKASIAIQEIDHINKRFKIISIKNLPENEAQLFEKNKDLLKQQSFPIAECNYDKLRANKVFQASIMLDMFSHIEGYEILRELYKKEKISDTYLLPVQAFRKPQFFISIIVRDKKVNLDFELLESFTIFCSTIQERLLIQDELNTKQWELEKALLASNMGSFTYDVRSKKFHYTHKATEILEVYKNDVPVTYKDFIDRIYEEDKSLIEGLFNNNFRNVSEEYTFRFISKNGKIKWLKTTISKEIIEEKYVGTLRDISKQVEMNQSIEEKERKLVESREQLTLAAAGAELGIFDWNLDSNITTYNEMFYELFDIEDRNCVGNPKELFEIFSFEDNPDLQPFEEIYQDKVVNIDLKLKVLTRNNQVKWIHIKGAKVNNRKGHPGRVIAVVNDVSKLKELEIEVSEKNERLSSLINSLPGVVFSSYLDNNLSMTYLSPYIYKISGYKDAEFYPNGVIKFIDIVHPSDKNELVKSIRTSHKNKQKIESTFRIISKTGSVKYLSLTASFKNLQPTLEFSDTDGVILDITDRVKTEEKILNSAVNATDQERKRIAQEIHDGIQQLLVAGLLNFESVKKELKTASEKTNKRFAAGINYLNEGINETRAIARKLMPKAIEDFGLVNAISELINFLPAEIDIQLYHNLGNNRFEEDIEIGIYRIVQEALSNAIKYAKCTTIFVQIIDTTNSIQVEIEDNGIGFDVNREFSTSNGYGLYSIRSRISLLKGTMNIRSEKNKGTIIIADIPKKMIYEENTIN